MRRWGEGGRDGGDKGGRVREEAKGVSGVWAGGAEGDNSALALRVVR